MISARKRPRDILPAAGRAAGPAAEPPDAVAAAPAARTPATRVRLDVLLVSRGLVPSREQGRAAILAGEVFVGGQRASSPAERVSPGAAIEVRPRRPRFASRGGLKLEHALTAFGVDARGRVVLDVGASTGGFTDCLLQVGAVRVYAVDVGTGQLAWPLRNDPRVVSMERTDIRAVAPEDLAEVPALATIDVAFIGLGKVLPAVGRLLAADGEIIALVKPQFEAGPRAGRGGVVTDPAVHRQVLRAVAGDARRCGFGVIGVTFSPLRGPEGNIEFFMHLARGRRDLDDVEGAVARVVAEAHAAPRPGRAGAQGRDGGSPGR